MGRALVSLDRVGHLGPECLLGTVGLHLAPRDRAGGGKEHQDDDLLHDCLLQGGTTRPRRTRDGRRRSASLAQPREGQAWQPPTAARTRGSAVGAGNIR